MIPSSIASLYSTFAVSKSVLINWILNSSSLLCCSPTTILLASWITVLASSIAIFASDLLTSVFALSFSSTNVVSSFLLKSGLFSRCPLIVSYSSEIGCVAWTSASLELFSSRFNSNAQKWPNVSSSVPANSNFSFLCESAKLDGTLVRIIIVNTVNRIFFISLCDF